MLDETGMRNLWKQIDELWVQPEIVKRQAEGTLQDNFVIQQCLILLPKGKHPIVQFNEEAGFHAKVQIAEDMTLTPGQAVYLHEFKRIEKVLPPTVNEERVAFIFIFWRFDSYYIIFDFTPNWPEEEISDSEFSVGETIAGIMNERMVGSVVGISKNTQRELHEVGLWPATSLLPYPISRILERIGANHIAEAREILIKYCDTKFIEELVETWWSIGVFETRKDLFREAVFAHANGKYRLSTYTLIPQIEGVISDWLVAQMPVEELKYHTKSKVKQFRAALEPVCTVTPIYKVILESLTEFIVDGLPLKKFEKWLDKIDTSFPGRHPVAHGRYEEDLFIEENSIKLFLLLDTVCQFMIWHDLLEQGSE